MDRYPVDSKNNLESFDEPTAKGVDPVHQPHIGDARMDSKDRVFCHDGTSKDDMDHWSEDEPSPDALNPNLEFPAGEEENYHKEEEDLGNEEGYIVSEHPDSQEDDFDDENRS
jgi:hypothetical protein